MAQAKLNPTSKALKTVMAKMKKESEQIKTEYDMAFCVSATRGDVWTQKRICEEYDRFGDANGFTKITHLHCHNGNKFALIVVKRFAHFGGVVRGTNQLISEIDCWEQNCNTWRGDALCPILKYHKERSDKAGAHTTEKGKARCVIIAQKAVAVGDAEDMCAEAEYRNMKEGYRGMPAYERKKYLEAVSDDMGWWDAMDNGGNSGVIFDYDQKCYKAVFIDYAL